MLKLTALIKTLDRLKFRTCYGVTEVGRNIGGSDAGPGAQLDGDLHQYLQKVPNNKLNAATCHAAAMLGTPQMADRKRIEARTICPVRLHLSHVTLTVAVSCPRSYSAEATAVDRGPEFPHSAQAVCNVLQAGTV